MDSPRWKDDLRRRCLERASQSRSALVAAARAGCAPSATWLPDVCTEVLGELTKHGALAPHELSDLARALEETLRREVEADIAALDAAPPALTCPVCSAGAVVSLVDGWLVCSRYGTADGCELRLNSPNQPRAVDALRFRFEEVIQAHRLRCRGEGRCRMLSPVSCGTMAYNTQFSGTLQFECDRCLLRCVVM